MTTAYGAFALADEVAKVRAAVEGTRNPTLNTSWFKICQLVAEGHIDRDDAYTKIRDAALSTGLGPAEVDRTMASAERGGTSKPRATPPPDVATSKPPGSPDFSGTENFDDRLRVAFDDLYIRRSTLKQLPQPESYIDMVLDKRCLFSITGRGGTYKSFLALNWLACLATGQSWLGRAVEQAKVLYVVGEGLYGLHDRIAAWEAAWNVAVTDEWFHVRRAPVNLYKRAADALDLRERIERERYQVIIFDTLQRSSAGADVNLAKDAGLIVDTMAALRVANPDAAIGYVAHTGKAEEFGTRGSSALEDDLDIVWRLTHDEDSEIISAEMVKRRDGPEAGKLELAPKSIPGMGSIVLQKWSPLPDSAGHPKWTIDVLRQLDGPLAKDGLSQSRIMQALGMRSWDSMRRAGNWLLEHDLAITVGRGSHMRLKITEKGKAVISQPESSHDQTA